LCSLRPLPRALCLGVRCRILTHQRGERRRGQLGDLTDGAAGQRHSVEKAEPLDVVV
jgi:hypothetical protein